MKFTKRTMTKKQWILVGVVFVVVLIGAVAFSKEYQKAYDVINQQSFRENFKQSFLRACYANNTSVEAKKMCDCIVNQAIYELSLEQLKDEAFMKNYVENKAHSDCKTEKA